MGNEDIVETETLYSGSMISLLRYHVTLGGRRLVREVVKHPGAVAVIPVNDEGRIIMVKQHRLPSGRSLLEIPAGTRRVGEDEEECAHRELLEETGYRARVLRKVLSFYPAPGYSTEKITLFLAEDLEKAEQRLEEDEAIEVVEKPLEEALVMLRNGLVEDAKTIIGLYWLAEQLKAAGRVG
ncbi:MAG: NUDIX hydrolase [Crenarchaeota archaeon]|nr:NUDIX hydrolase [Thermoproteota archaeon]